MLVPWLGSECTPFSSLGVVPQEVILFFIWGVGIVEYLFLTFDLLPLTFGTAERKILTATEKLCRLRRLRFPCTFQSEGSSFATAQLIHSTDGEVHLNLNRVSFVAMPASSGALTSKNTCQQ